MEYEVNEKKLIEIFVFTDDFCKLLDRWLQENGHQLPRFKGGLSISEVLTILIFYHHSGFKCFEYYYRRMVLGGLSSYFPKAVSYKRFLSLIPRSFNHLYLLATMRSLMAERTGIYFVDSKKLPVCHNRRIHAHRVFKGQAQRGKSSTGWFFGFKLHLVINNKGQIAQFLVTSANVADNNQAVLNHLFEGLKGCCFGDKGYLTKLFEHFYVQGFKIITKLRNNMKNQLMQVSEKLWLAKRAVIESVNDILKTVCDIDHTRHRSPVNAFVHLFGGLTAYSFFDDEPSVNVPNSLP
jgi:hypothetical protein